MTTSYPPMIEETFAPGQPIVDRQGPLLPALDTNVILCFSISDRNCSIIFLGIEKTKTKQKKQSVSYCVCTAK